MVGKPVTHKRQRLPLPGILRGGYRDPIRWLACWEWHSHHAIPLAL